MINAIYDYLKDIEIIDTHEHLQPLEKNRVKNDVIDEFLSCYYHRDMISDGLSAKTLEEVRSGSMTLTEKWDALEKYWEDCKYTGYGKVLSIAAKDLYGVDRICRETVEELNEAYQRSFDGHYKHVLKDMSHIKIAILDSGSIPDKEHVGDVDREFFKNANRVNDLMRPQLGTDLVLLEKMTDVSITSFDSYLRACALRLDQYYDISPILKCSLAYNRDLNFERATKHEAEKAFDAMMLSMYYNERTDLTFSPASELVNYMFRFVAGYAQDRGMVMQVHTGYQDGNCNLLSNCNPVNFSNVLIDFPRLKFDLFHMGYPYEAEFGAMCKMFQNAYADMCWAHALSPVASKRALSEWLELFPYTKISGFGGDYAFASGTYGHQKLARYNISQVLSEKVEEGLFDEEEACKIGKAILYDNPAKLFGVE